MEQILHQTRFHFLNYLLISLILLPKCSQSTNTTDHLALLKFRQGITDDPVGIFNSWNSSLPFCTWSGVTCSRRHPRVTSLILTGHNLLGTISPYIGNLSFLRSFNLQNNTFSGYIPQEVGNLFRLKDFRVNNNSLSGEIPNNLSRCNKLEQIDLRFNQFGGTIPSEFGALTKLQMLFLNANNIGGEIPPSLANISTLVDLFLSRNNLVGKIPEDIARLKSLETFAVGGNYLSGIVPPSLFNTSSIVLIETVDNQLYGTLPDTLGLTLPRLQAVYIGGNQFSGSIPNSLSNASQLQILDIPRNTFEGQVPNFGNHPELVWLALSENNLGTNSSTDLMFLASLKNSTNLESLSLGYNNFGGVLPNYIANLSTDLNGLYFGGNQLRGTIPDALEKFTNLFSLGLEGNFFTGVVPSYFGKFRKLQGLNLWGNELSGEIPSSFGNLTQLVELSLSQNQLKGSIPPSLGNCSSLNYLSLERNDLEGDIPQELTRLTSLSMVVSLADNSLSGNLPGDIGRLININYLNVSENKLSGKIPRSIGDCLALEYLYMQGNSFRGAIPSSLASLRGLQEIDLSRNNLTGEIPKDLQNLPFLRYLNLSLNDLEGEVPTEGVFGNATALSLIGNSKLCGGVPQLLLPKCPGKPVKKGMSRALKMAVAATCALLGVVSILASLLVYRRKKSGTSSSSMPVLMDQYVKVSYRDLHHATNGFSSDNLIGSGSFGSVYKGSLNEIDRPIAIKVLKLEERNAFKTLIAECNVLKNVRHRNLVKLISYCSSLDYRQNEFKTLIFEFMENGSVDRWLHRDDDSIDNHQLGNLSFLQRLNIVIDVASALHYLHDLYERSIIHCDLKPSNVLLDKDMVARVSDFGLARFLQTTDDASQIQSSSTVGIKGTVGYAPPEYGMGNPASREGDAYSFGILLLEMFSGKRPTDVMFTNGLNLHNFVKNALPERLMEIVDQTINREMEAPAPAIGTIRDSERERRAGEESNNRDQRAHQEKCLMSVLEIGIACSRESPHERMKMAEAAKALQFTRSSFLGVRLYEE